MACQKAHIQDGQVRYICIYPQEKESVFDKKRTMWGFREERLWGNYLFLHDQHSLFEIHYLVYKDFG